MSGYIDPDREIFAQFKDLPRDEKIHMLNLVELNDTAHYQDGTLLTGREAYGAYSRESGPIFEKLGGRIVWSGQFEMMLIGPADKAWDICFIAEYPNAEAFIAMVYDPQYREAVKHRQAAVRDSRLIRLAPQEPGKSFG